MPDFAEWLGGLVGLYCMLEEEQSTVNTVCPHCSKTFEPDDRVIVPLSGVVAHVACSKASGADD